MTRPGVVRRSRGIPVMPDPNGDEKLFRLRMIEAVKELYRRVESIDRRLSSAEMEVGGGG